MVDAAAVLQAVALVIQAGHSKEIEFPLGLSEKEIEILRREINRKNKHINRRLVVVPGIRMEQGPGTLFILGPK